MQTIQFVPGAIVSPNPITIPDAAPDIYAVVSAQIARLPASLADHDPADIVAAMADHAAHDHDITMVGPAGAGAAVTAPAAPGPLEQVGGPVTNPGAVDVLAAAQAHAGSAVAVAHAGGNPVVAAVPTRLTTRTISLDVNTLVGDVLSLDYIEVGEKVPVS